MSPRRTVSMGSYIVFICLLSLVVSDNSTIGENSAIEDASEIANVGNNVDVDTVEQTVTWGEWSPWSKWSACSRSCGGGISKQQRRCRRKPCKGRPWTTKYKICNPQPCEKKSDFRAEQCAAFDDVPYSGQLLKWYPHYDPERPCSLICRGEQSLESSANRLQQDGSNEQMPLRDAQDALQLDSEETIVVQLANKVEDGTRCYTDGTDVCINGECMKVGCDLRIGSNKNTDACGVCGGNGSTCQSKYVWDLQSVSACSKSCGEGYRIAVPVCKAIGPDERVVDDSHCDVEERPKKSRVPCNMHPCMTKWVTEEWSKCSATCGGGTRTRTVFCTEENGNATTRLPDYKCNGVHKPHVQEDCNTISCPMWETDEWSECSASCGRGVRRRNVECRDANGLISRDCDFSERPRGEQECKANIECSYYGEDLTQPLMQPYPPPPVPEKLIDQPIPSESTFIAEEWSPCSVTCGEGIRHREVHCKIFLEFSRTIAKLPDRQCSGPKPEETEKCVMETCSLMENSLSYRIDTVGDSGYAESSLTDSYRSPSGSSAGDGYDSNIKVAPAKDAQTTYSWREAGYTPCSSTCLAGVQELIINCVRDDNEKTVTPFLCSKETKPEARIRTCNDHPCPPRWKYSEFLPCMSPCGIGIQTRDVTCIQEVIRGNGNIVSVPSHLCPQPPPADRQYCNVLDCPVKWSVGEWGECSKTCGGGVKRRNVTCEQIMALGRKQTREEDKCPSLKPPSEKPCNTKPCNEMDMNVKPIILSLNSTFNQSNINDKVDLRIGGIAKVIQGTPYIKIRCPVKKFDKAQLIWKKDHNELRKSKKYKISRKGALKIVDITPADNGIYACIAGSSHAETRVIVKFRSKDQISSEEYIRVGNSVHLQRNVNLDSAPANSGESLYTDRAAAYGNHFRSIDGEDFSHERAAPSSKPTRKPQHKRQRTSPTPPGSTMMHKEHTVTSLNQPGYHESVDSTATSGASSLIPHLNYLISGLKAYWPFQGSSRNHRTAPVSFIDEVHKDSATTKRTMSDKKTGFRYQNVHDDIFDNLHRNTAIPDKVLNSEEERIFIDLDPYELDETIFADDQVETMKHTPNMLENDDMASATGANMDYIEESLRNVKRQWQESQINPKHQKNVSNYTERTVNAVEASGDGGLQVYYVQDTTTKKNKSTNDDVANVTFDNLRDETEVSIFDQKDKSKFADGSVMDESEKQKTNDQLEADTETVETSYVQNRDKESSTTVRGSTFDIDNEKMKGEFHRFDRSNLTNEEALTSGENFEDVQWSQKSDASANITMFTTADSVESSEPTTGMGVTLDNTEELVFEWVTTDWSKCSQTCGGSGFQMRGAQCTVRPVKLANSTRLPPRTVIGATLCEDAGHPVPQKVRTCGAEKCPQWHTTEWTPCETSRCFNWKTAMQRRDISCRLIEDLENGQQNVTLLDPSKCDEATRPLQRQECYNDACKGVWRVGEWSECIASCEENGIKYRILQCVWYGTKKPAGNACRDIPRPPVMKTCRGPPCPQSPDDCKDHSQLCSKVKKLNICKVPLYQKQCCASCH